MNQPSVTAVAVESDLLYAVSHSGHLLPLYVYGPLTTAGAPADVPFLGEWPPYASGYAAHYVPVPALDPAAIPDSLEDAFWSQPRPAGERGWVQAVYQGYPLYLWGDGTGPDPAGVLPPPGDTAMFVRASTALRGGPVARPEAGGARAGGGVGTPPESLGP